MKIYGSVRSRANRSIWCAEELGLTFETIPMDFSKKEHLAPAFLALNPNGRVPTLDDDGYILFESLAINLYLVKKHGGDLAPKDLAEDGRMTMWSMWAVSEIEPHALTVLMHTMILPADKRDAALRDKGVASLERPMLALDAALAVRDHLVGERFTVADLNVACVVAYLRAAPELMTRCPNVARWLEPITKRPIYAKIFGAMR